jgi:hypothetical protein
MGASRIIDVRGLKKFSMAKSNGSTSMRSKTVDVPVCDAAIWKAVDVNDET